MKYTCSLMLILCKKIDNHRDECLGKLGTNDFFWMVSAVMIASNILSIIYNSNATSK